MSQFQVTLDTSSCPDCCGVKTLGGNSSSKIELHEGDEVRLTLVKNV